MRLERRAEYKTLYISRAAPATAADVDVVVGAFAGFLASADTSSAPDTDPRALPFSSFDLGRRVDEDLGLNTEDGRSEFEKEFGPHRARRDSSAVSWNLHARDYHGRDTLLLRGRPLPAGFHWDVPGPRGGAHVLTPTEVWYVTRTQYINVYPDAYVRTTREGGRRIWPRNT